VQRKEKKKLKKEEQKRRKIFKENWRKKEEAMRVWKGGPFEP